MTLVELAVVVVIIAVLAVVAIVGYRKYVRAGRMTEVNTIVSEIMTAQHKHRSERGAYANVSNTAVDFYPRANPVGTQKTQWGADCGNCVTPRSWDTLGVNPAAPVMFGYATVGGFGGQPEAPPEVFNGPAMIATLKAPSGPAEPFFIVTGALDFDNNGNFCQVTAVSGTNRLFVSNPDE